MIFFKIPKPPQKQESQENIVYFQFLSFCIWGKNQKHEEKWRWSKWFTGFGWPLNNLHLFSVEKSKRTLSHSEREITNWTQETMNEQYPIAARFIISTFFSFGTNRLWVVNNASAKEELGKKIERTLEINEIQKRNNVNYLSATSHFVFLWGRKKKSEGNILRGYLFINQNKKIKRRLYQTSICK